MIPQEIYLDKLVILDAKSHWSLYLDHVTNIKSNLTSSQIYTNYQQLIAHIFDKIMVNAQYAMSESNLNLQYYHLPQDPWAERKMIDTLSELDPQLGLLINHELIKHQLLKIDNGYYKLEDYYLKDTNHIYHMLKNSGTKPNF